MVEPLHKNKDIVVVHTDSVFSKGKMDKHQDIEHNFDAIPDSKMNIKWMQGTIVKTNDANSFLEKTCLSYMQLLILSY